MTDLVRRVGEFLPRFFPLPHPAWRSAIWMKKNPWFEEEVLPVLRAEVRRALSRTAASQ
jgi:uracil-DNA glycosylase